jgi:benzoyl-CoA reductase/2-hydroxyglutaryl-CoA dehydratase subunit BcrC/BadD/HgdB
MNDQELAVHLRDRATMLRKVKESGAKIIGYFPGNYVPEEIIHAAGAIPLCLTDGGSSQTADSALAVVPRVICPFARMQVGERMLKTNPYYSMLDMVVAPVTCQHLKKVAEIWEYYGDMEIFKLGIPHQADGDFELEYYIDRLHALRDKIESFTGNKITDGKIKEAIDLYNRMRERLKDISLMRRDSVPPLSTLDFVRLNHASFYADPVFMVEILDSLHEELKKKRSENKPNRPRLMLVGPNLARGDYNILEMVQAAGGEIVIEEICEGMRNYWQHVENNDNPLQSLAKSYLRDRIPCAYMRDSTRKRLDFILRLIKDFHVSGVIWYELLCCETYDQESYFLNKKMQERDIPMLIVESNYDIVDGGPLRNRLDAFMEMVRGGPENA